MIALGLLMWQCKIVTYILTGVRGQRDQKETSLVCLAHHSLMTHHSSITQSLILPILLTITKSNQTPHLRDHGHGETHHPTSIATSTSPFSQNRSIPPLHSLHENGRRSTTTQSFPTKIAWCGKTRSRSLHWHPIRRPTTNGRRSTKAPTRCFVFSRFSAPSYTTINQWGAGTDNGECVILYDKILPHQ